MRLVKSISAASAALFTITLLCSSCGDYGAIANVLVNDGFEVGDLTGWQEPLENPNPWTVVSTKSHTGKFSAYNPALLTAISETTLYQPFTPFLGRTIKTAGFWYWTESSSASVGLAVLLKFSDGTWAQDTLFSDDPLFKQGQWAYRDLMPTLRAAPEKYLVEIGFFPKAGVGLYIDDVLVSAAQG